MSKKKVEEDLWESHKEELYQLHEIQSKTLPSIMGHMKAQHGFIRSKSQYERVFKNWGFKTKKISKSEWEYIEARLLEREAQGKLNFCVRVRGQLVTQAKIKKQRRNYQMTTLERHRFLTQSIPRPVTSTDLEIFTPQDLSPILRPIEAERNEDLTVSPHITLSDDLRISLAERTPWCCFIRLLSTLYVRMDYQQSFSQSMSTDGRFPGDQGSEFEPGNDLWVPSRGFEESVDAVLSRQWIEDDDYGHPAIFDPLPYLPRRQRGSPDIDVYGSSDIARKGRFLELLKHTIFLISNNFVTDDITSAIVELARTRPNREFLKRLLSQGSATMEAFAGRLLFPAIIGRNYDLVYALLESGVDLNNVDDHGHTLLHKAIETSDENLFRQLFDCGVSVIECDLIYKNREFGWDRDDFRLLEIAFADAEIDIIDIIFRHLQREPEGPSHIRPKQTVLIAASRGDPALLDYIQVRIPEALSAFEQEPWLLFEAAALSQSIPMFGYLQALGFDISETDEEGCGSPLVYTVYQGNIQLAEYLFESGVQILTLTHFSYDSFHPGQEKRDILDQLLKLKPPQAYPDTWSAVEAAVKGADSHMVRYLISKGAHLNEPDRRSLVQLAAKRGSWKIMQALLDGGVLFPIAQPLYRGHSEQALDDLTHNMFDAEAVFVDFARMSGNESTVSTDCGSMTFYQIVDGLNEDSGSDRMGSSGRSSEPFDNEISDLFAEMMWNPLLVTAYHGHSELFSKLLDISTTQSQHWLTHQCLSQGARSFDWFLVEKLIEDPRCPPAAIYQAEVLAHFVKQDNHKFIKDLIKNQRLKHRHAGMVFAIAACLGKEDIVRLFLKAGHWPDDFHRVAHVRKYFLRKFVSNALGESFDELRVSRKLLSVFEEVLQMNNDKMENIILDYYREIVDAIDKPTIKRHFRQAYGIAIACGSTRSAKKLAETAGIGDVLYEIQPYEHSRIEPRLCFRSAIQLAAHFQQYDIVEWLLTNDTNINMSDEELHGPNTYASPLQCAARDGKISIVKKLIEMGANVNAKAAKPTGATALQFAAIRGHFDILEILLDAGAAQNAPSSAFEGRTAIEGAAERGLIDMVSYLLDLGADIKGRANVNYRRTVYRAWQHGHHALARLIHRWKVENDEDYSQAHDSIDAVLETMEARTLLFTAAEGDNTFLEWEMCDPNRICSVCLEHIEDEERLYGKLLDQSLYWSGSNQGLSR